MGTQKGGGSSRSGVAAPIAGRLSASQSVGGGTQATSSSRSSWSSQASASARSAAVMARWASKALLVLAASQVSAS
jgi:hypothetical protein